MVFVLHTGVFLDSAEPSLYCRDADRGSQDTAGNLIECTSFEHAGAMDKQGKEQLIAEVAESVESDADIPVAATSQPATAPTTAERITAGVAYSPS